MKVSRFSTPPARYDARDETAFRRAVVESLNDNEFDSIRIAGGVLYGEDGVLKFKSQNNTITTVGPL